MKYAWVFILWFTFLQVSASEWKSLKIYREVTGLQSLAAKDWLKSDRKRNTSKWQEANVHNLNNLLSSEYSTIVQRRDFYFWVYKALEEKGHQLVWLKMAHYISKKLRLTKAFPFNIFTKKSLQEYAYQGNEVVFNHAFPLIAALIRSSKALKNQEALEWDKTILRKEQYLWLLEIYSDVDDETLKTITKMAKGKGFYALLVPKSIRFQGDISNADTRYQYALNTLRKYCDEHYK